MALYKRLYGYFKPYILRAVEGGLSMAGVALLTTAIVWLIRTVVDDVLLKKDLHKLFLITLVVPLIYLLKGFFSYVQNYLMNYISQAIVRDLRQELYEHLQSLSLDFFHKNSTGRLMSRITNDTTMLQSAIAQVPVQIIRDGLTLVFLVGTILYLNWKFALFTLILLPLAALPVSILGKKLRRSGRQIQASMADLFSSLHEGITGNVITKVFCNEKKEIERFQNENRNYYSVTMRWVRADVLGAPIMEFLGSIAAVFLLWYGGRDVIRGVWSTGSFFTFLGASISAYKPVKDFTSVNSTIQQGLSCAERVFELLDEKPSVVERKDAVQAPLFRKMIEYSNVKFSYEPSTPVLKTINLKVSSGEIVAIVGHSGSGKTTLSQLLPRLFDPEEGAILLDGTDIRNFTLKSLREQIGIVTQDTILFNETVMYNIAYGEGNGHSHPDYGARIPVLGPGNRPERIDTSAIEHAAKIANAHDFILSLPNGYDTVIGERGVRLSGGQRQRLSIARAVLKNPPILILDEATSSLDTESERLVQEALERLMENRTVLVIAHRLSTIRQSDRIIVLDNGRIVEEGNHKTLMESSSSYKRLYELQIHS